MTKQKKPLRNKQDNNIRKIRGRTMNRTKAREYAFILIFEYRFQPDEIETILANFIEEYEPGNQQEYVENVVKGVVKKIDVIDSKIEEMSKFWEKDRISCVVMAILRLAIYEIMMCKDIPFAVSVNEAVALAKKYEGEDALPFVNGILGKIEKV